MDNNKLSITLQSVEWAYRLFLDREPENLRAAISTAEHISSTQQLRQQFLHSAEFKQRNPDFFSATLSGNEPEIGIDDLQDEDDLRAIFQHIQNFWEYLGTVQPYWSVLKQEQYRQPSIKYTENEFYETGQIEISRFFSTLDRNAIDYSGYKSCLDFGCGVGRITKWLAERFDFVHGCDISKPYLHIAETYLDRKYINNVRLHYIKTIKDIMTMPKADVVYSILTLQHNPPPLISLIISELIKTLNSGGVAFFQVPTYKIDYNFSLDEYLKNVTPEKKDSVEHKMEIHVLPQKIIFEKIKQQGGKLIEVLENNYTGLKYKEVSNTFVVQKG